MSLKKWRLGVEYRLTKATPWDSNDQEAASQAWKDNKVANADLCRHAPTDLRRALDEIDRLTTRSHNLEAARVELREGLRRAILFGENVIGKQRGEINWNSLEFARQTLRNSYSHE